MSTAAYSSPKLIRFRCAVPVVLGASAMGWLEGHADLRRSQRVLEIAGGVVLILSGLYMLNAYFFFVPGLAA